jgi:hypothetical protein
MSKRSWWRISLMICAASAALAASAQDKVTVPKVINVLGLQGVKANATGTLSVEGSTMKFVAGTSSAELPIASVEDVFTGADSARVVGGTLGTLSMFAPYEAGRFLSLFRKKIDSLTIEYRDGNGGLHGVILTMPEGQAALVKKQMVAMGAHASIPVEEEVKAEQEKKAHKEKKK